MKPICKIIALTAMCMMLVGVNAQAQGQGETVLGVDLGYVSRHDTGKIGVFFQYALADHIRVAPALSGYLRHKGTDALVADVDIQFPMDITQTPCKIYPFAGLNFASWSIHHPLDVVHDTRVGCNLGAGVEYYFKSNMKFNVELKYVLTQHYSTFVGTIGLGYVF